jgi:hypothetical protein
MGCLTSKSRKDLKLISYGIKASLMFVYFFALTVEMSRVQAGLSGSDWSGKLY